MIVVCPNCQTRFNLADDKAVPGVKLRCSVCKHVFVLPEPEPAGELPVDTLAMPGQPVRPADEAGAEPGQAAASQLSLGAGSVPAGGGQNASGNGAGIVLLLALALALGLAAWLYYAPPAGFDPFGRNVQELPKSVSDKVSRIALTDVRQYRMPNERVGVVLVVEGNLVNTFETPREKLVVEVVLYDEAGRPVASKRQMAGNTLTMLQLQSLSEKEMEAALQDENGISRLNANVAPGRSVPFMVVVANPARGVSDFGVKVVSALAVAG